MAILDGFIDKDMIEQIMTLEEIGDANPSDFLPELINIFAEAKVDQSVEEMLYHTIFKYLAGQTSALINGLKHSSDQVVILCIRRAYEDGNDELLPALKELLESSDSNEIISEILRAFGAFSDPLLTKTVIPFIEHEDSAVVAWSMHTLVELGSDEAVSALNSYIENKAVLVEKEGICDLNTTQAISSIANIKNDAVVNFLIKYIHHPVALFRKEVINAFISIGEFSLPALGECISNGHIDEKIMAANVIGWIRHRKGADILVALLDEIPVMKTNLKFAIFESLGRIPSIRSFTVLVDALKEDDEMVLMAVVTGLNNLCNPGIIKKIDDLFGNSVQQAELVTQSIIASRSCNIFKELYNTGNHRTILIKALASYKDQETIGIFKELLSEIGGTHAQEDITRLSEQKVAATTKRVIAVDDSKAMLFFYKNAASDIGIELTTFPDGTDAFEYFKNEKDAQSVDLLITDMNMPGMDGLELTVKLREIERWANLPIIMATTETENYQANQAEAAGVNDFISKPFTKDVLKEKLSATLGL